MKQTHQRVKDYLSALRLIGDWRSEGLIRIFEDVDQAFENHIEPEIHDPKAIPASMPIIEEDDLATIGLAEKVVGGSLPEPVVDEEITLALPAPKVVS
jgi:hypothetical protein